jgi:xylulokinase
MSKKIIAWDLGTGGNKASLYDLEGNCLAATFVDYPTLYPKHGWHEQRPEDWWNAIVTSTHKLMEESSVDKNDIYCCGISGHSLGSVPMDKDGNLLREYTPIWSDTRAVQQSDEFFKTYNEDKWYQITGSGFTPAMYTAFKIMWYRDNEPEMYKKIDKVIGTKDYVNYKLTGKISTDYSYASGSGVYDLANWKYSDELITAFGLPKEMFPEIVASTDVIGTISAEVAEQLGLTAKVKVVSGGVDNSCMALGAKAFKEGAIYSNLGSCIWIAVSSQKPLLDTKSRPYVFAHVVPNYYASALCITSGCTSLRWVKEQLAKNISEKAQAEGKNTYDQMDEVASKSLVGSNSLIFNPSLGGGMPLDKSINIRGAFLGLDLGHTQGDMFRATLEGIALGLRVCLDKLRELTPVSSEMLLVGGGSKSEVWRQIYADVYNTTILKSNIDQQAAALGAAACAAVGTGLWDNFDIIDRLHVIECRVDPIPENVAKYNKMLPIFKKASDYLSDIGDMINELDK